MFLEQGHFCCRFVTAKMHRNGSVCRSYKYSALESRHLRKYFPPTLLCVQPQRHEIPLSLKVDDFFAMKELFPGRIFTPLRVLFP